MNFKLYEEMLTEEELEQEMNNKAKEREKVLLYTADMFNDAGFEKNTTANYISYSQSGDNYNALFSIDTTSFNYSCYVTTEGDNTSTYSARGIISGIEEAVIKFLEAVADVSEK